MNVEQRVRTSVEKRISRLNREYEEYPILQEILKLDNHDCYEIFRISNTYPEDLDQLASMIINGLYDDSQLGAVSGPHGYFVSYVSDDHVNQIDEDDLFRIIKLCNDCTKHREANEELFNINLIEGGDKVISIYREYLRLRDLLKDEILKFKEV